MALTGLFSAGAWPWGPFAAACLGRISWGLTVFLFLEGKLIGLAPAILRSVCFYSVATCVATWFVQQMISLATQGPTPDMQVHSESGSFRDSLVSWVASGMRGWRDAMEDAHVVDQLRKDVFEDALLFAVLDGHGGSGVSSLSSKLLVQEVETCARELKKGTDQAAFIADVLGQSLPRLDARLRGNSFGGWMLPGPLHPFTACGSTAVVAAVDFVSREVIVANIGDSRALLIRHGKAIALSTDHKPEDPIERNRIRAAGGQVIKMGPCHRVDGNLNLSRALGDFNLKANHDLPPEKQKVIAFPDITRTSFIGGPDELLLIGCDGLFERLSNQDIANLVWPRLKNGMALNRIASELLHACCARSLRGRPIEEGTDNETVILVQLPAKAESNGSEELASAKAGTGQQEGDDAQTEVADK
eukprot:TRINITY_DN11328_c0_g1_i1.p1 TRINITY_DN11328_c0_g1~~TRINITY_DN11328_c0_g1_i1.p1  ORF type:complete len:436 (-),score=74.17 TRINITY_DN11328_c0_g1_i1:17-1267(-)